MRKTTKSLVAAVLSACFLFGAAACEKNPGPGPSGGSGLKGNINFLVPMANVDNDALEAMANAYMDINRGVTITITKNNGNGYSELVRAAVAAPEAGVVNIVRISQIAEYYGTDKVVDFTDYLDEENDYAEGSPSYDGTWKSVLEADAYPIEGKANTIPALSYESNYTVCFYDKRAMNDLMKDPDYAPETWEELLALLEKAKSDGYASPLGLSFNESSCAGIFMGWMIKMYADQYFRDFIGKAHSLEGDYSYIAADKNWNYEEMKGDPGFDRTEVYSSNLNRTIDAFFNEEDYNVTSARYAEMMGHFKELAPYAGANMTDERSGILGLDETANYWNEQTGVGGTASGSELAKKNVFLRPARLDSVLDYITRYGLDKTENNGGNVAEIISERFGWFEMPAMPDNGGEGAPAADNVRSMGGPVNELGIINNGNAEYVEAAVDFLKFVLSPKGQNIRYDTYLANGYTAVMPSLVKDCTISQKIDQASDRSYTSGCERNPINTFTLGYGDGNITVSGSTETLNNRVGTLYSEYLLKGKAWSSVAAQIQSAIEASFGQWAEYRGLKYTAFDRDTINRQTNNMKENPVRDTQ
ncbi:MAG: extracellular solute-binding protein [Firmicutes bacterium]|jgi:lipoprotein|nr:extracellular solute-binding protein [Bacillota bacterium]